VSVLDQLAERLPDGALSTHPGELAARSHDWWSLALLRERRGDRTVRPTAVVFPTSVEDVATTLRWAAETGTAVVPRGAGSGVCGGAEAVRRSIIIDMTTLSNVLAVEANSLTAHVQAGVRGDRLEQALSVQGLTLGHYPQSLAISTVGGWIAAASAGQASAGYGAIEDLVLGMTVVLAGGDVVRLPPRPRSAAGPDLRRLFIGSEGTLGVVAEAVLSVSRAPRSMAWDAYRPSSFEMGVELARQVSQVDVHPLVLRVYDEADAALAFGGLGHSSGPAVLLGFDGSSPGVDGHRGAARRMAHDLGASDLGPDYGTHWWEHRNDAVETYRRIMGEERLLGVGVMVDTMEIAGLWSDLPGLYKAVRDCLASVSQTVGCHISHPYRSGASLYFTFLLRGTGDVEVEDRYVSAWSEAVRACHAAGGTMTHHHGVGLLKAPYMEEELGPDGLALLRRLKAAVDPQGILNPGKLLP
jgi:alkyldihydroxyacetonephosphate synthase